MKKLLLFNGSGLGHFVNLENIVKHFGWDKNDLIVDISKKMHDKAKEKGYFILEKTSDLDKIEEIWIERILDINLKYNSYSPIYQKIRKLTETVKNYIICQIKINQELSKLDYDKFECIYLMEPVCGLDQLMMRNNVKKLILRNEAPEHSTKYENKVLVVHSGLIDPKEVLMIYAGALRNHKPEDIVIITQADIKLSSSAHTASLIVNEYPVNQYFKFAKEIHTNCTFNMTFELKDNADKVKWYIFERPYEAMKLRRDMIINGRYFNFYDE